MKTVSRFHYQSSPQKGLIDRGGGYQHTNSMEVDNDDNDDSSTATVKVNNQSSSRKATTSKTSSSTHKNHSHRRTSDKNHESASTSTSHSHSSTKRNHEHHPLTRSKSPLQSSSSSRSMNNNKNQHSTSSPTTTTRTAKPKDDIAVDVLSLLFYTPVESSSNYTKDHNNNNASTIMMKPKIDPFTEHVLQSKKIERENDYNNTYINNTALDDTDITKATSDVFDGLSDVASSVFNHILEKMDRSSLSSIPYTPRSTTTNTSTTSSISSSVQSRTSISSTASAISTIKSRELQSEIVGNRTTTTNSSSIQDIAMKRKARLSSRFGDSSIIRNRRWTNRSSGLTNHHLYDNDDHDDEVNSKILHEDRPFDEEPSTLSSSLSMKTRSSMSPVIINNNYNNIHKSSSSSSLLNPNENTSISTPRVSSSTKVYEEELERLSTRIQQPQSPTTTTSSDNNVSPSTVVFKYHYHHADNTSSNISTTNNTLHKEPLTPTIITQPTSPIIGKSSPSPKSNNASPTIPSSLDRHKELLPSKTNLQPTATSPLDNSSFSSSIIHHTSSSPELKSIPKVSPQSIPKASPHSIEQTPEHIYNDESLQIASSDISKIIFPNLDDKEITVADTIKSESSPTPNTLPLPASMKPLVSHGENQCLDGVKTKQQNRISLDSSDLRQRNHTAIKITPIKQEDKQGRSDPDNTLSQSTSRSLPLSPKSTESLLPPSPTVEGTTNRNKSIELSKNQKSTSSVINSQLEKEASKHIDDGKGDKKTLKVDSHSMKPKEEVIVTDPSKTSRVDEKALVPLERGLSMTNKNSPNLEGTPLSSLQSSYKTHLLKDVDRNKTDWPITASQKSKTSSHTNKTISRNDKDCNSITTVNIPSLKASTLDKAASTPIKAEQKKTENKGSTTADEKNKTKSKPVPLSVIPTEIETKKLQESAHKLSDQARLSSLTQKSSGFTGNSIKQDFVSTSSIGTSHVGNSSSSKGLVQTAKQKWELLMRPVNNFDKVPSGQNLHSDNKQQHLSDCKSNELESPSENLVIPRSITKITKLQEGQDRGSFLTENNQPLRSVSPQFRSTKLQDSTAISSVTPPLKPQLRSSIVQEKSTTTPSGNPPHKPRSMSPQLRSFTTPPPKPHLSSPIVQEKSTTISSITPPPNKPQTKQQLLEAFYRESLSQKSSSQVGNTISSHPSGSTTLGIHDILESSCLANCAMASTSPWGSKSETSTQQNIYNKNTSQIPYAKVLRSSTTRPINAFNDSTVDNRKSIGTIATTYDSINALADDLTVFTLDTVGASSLRVNFENDEHQATSNLTSTAGLPQSLISNLKKKMTTVHAVNKPTEGSSNKISQSFDEEILVTHTRFESTKAVKDLSPFEWISAVTSLYEAKRPSQQLSFLDIFNFPSKFYPASSPKGAEDFPFHLDTSSKLVFQRSTILMLHFLTADQNKTDTYSIVRKIWKRFLVKSDYSDEITRCYEEIIKKDNYPYRLSVSERAVTVIYNILGLLASNNLQGAIDFMHRFLKELIQYGISQDDLITGCNYHNLGVLYFLAKRADVAKQYFVDAFNIQMRHTQGPNLEKVSLCNEIGVCFFLTGQFSKALVTFDEALVLMLSAPTDTSCSMFCTLWSNKAATYYYMDDKGNCINALNKVVEFYRDMVLSGTGVESSSLAELENLLKGIDDSLRNMAFVYTLLNIPSEHLKDIYMTLERLLS